MEGQQGGNGGPTGRRGRAWAKGWPGGSGRRAQQGGFGSGSVDVGVGVFADGVGGQEFLLAFLTVYTAEEALNFHLA